MADDIEQVKIYNATAADWVKLHADQRSKLFNYFILFVGLCINSYVAALGRWSALPIPSTIIAIFLLVVSIYFAKLDSRNQHSIRAGLDAASSSLDRVRNSGSFVGMNFIVQSRDLGNELSHTEIFAKIFLLVEILAGLGIIFPWIAAAVQRSIF